MTIIKNRPFLLLFFSISAFILSALDAINPLKPILEGAFGLGTDRPGISIEAFVQGAIGLIRMLLAPNSLPILLITMLIVSVSGALLTALMLSGVLHIIVGGTEGRVKSRGEFIEGIRMHYWKMFNTCLKAFFFGILASVVLLVATLPLLTLAGGVLGAQESLRIPFILLLGITLFAVILTLLYLQANISFWFPASMTAAQSILKQGRKLTGIGTGVLLAGFGVWDMGLVLTVVLMNLPQLARISTVLRVLIQGAIMTPLLSGMVLFVVGEYRVRQKN